MTEKLDYHAIPPAEHLLTEKAAAVLLSISVSSLQKYRVLGGGPAYLRIGTKRVRYRRSDLIEWLQGCTHANTTEEGYRHPRTRKQRVAAALA